MKYTISKNNRTINGRIRLSGSKSISNRVLLIRALCDESFVIDNLASANDTILLQQLLAEDQPEKDAGPAGTTFRFLTAFLSLKSGVQTLTGSERMKQRPIKILVDALRQIGAKIDYLEKEGYPPLKIKEAEVLGANNQLSIDAGVSSQYISALLMIAPSLPNGLELKLVGEVVSLPYIQMTLNIMAFFGIEYLWVGDTIKIQPQSYEPKYFDVEADWSAASYYYEMVAMAEEADLYLDGLQKNSLQGDAAIVKIMQHFGVITEYTPTGVHLRKSGKSKIPFEYNFVKCPDLAQTVVVACAATGTEAKMTGLKTLRIKETDRIEALDQELKKIGSSFEACDDQGAFCVKSKAAFGQTPAFDTYEDHRMAMAFAPLAMMGKIEINEPTVVKKSYPFYWDDLQKIGFLVGESS